MIRKSDIVRTELRKAITQRVLFAPSSEWLSRLAGALEEIARQYKAVITSVGFTVAHEKGNLLGKATFSHPMDCTYRIFIGGGEVTVEEVTPDLS